MSRGLWPARTKEAWTSRGLQPARPHDLRFASHPGRQGQRTSNPLCRNDFHQELIAPAGDFALPFDAVVRGVALEEADREAAMTCPHCTYVNTLSPVFSDRARIIDNMESMLHQGWYTQNYIGKDLLTTLPELVETPEDRARLIDGLAVTVKNDAKIVVNRLSELPHDWGKAVDRSLLGSLNVSIGSLCGQNNARLPIRCRSSLSICRPSSPAF